MLARNRGRLITHRACSPRSGARATRTTPRSCAPTSRTCAARSSRSRAAPRYIRTDPGVGYRFAAECGAVLHEHLDARAEPRDLDASALTRGGRTLRHVDV